MDELEQNQIEAQSTEPQDNPYGQQFDQDLNSAAYVAKEKDPDQHAKVMSLAESFGAKSDFVEKNYDLIRKKREEFELKNKLGETKEKAPKSTEFLANPDNLALSKDDIESFQKFESSIAKTDRAGQIESIIGFGLAAAGERMTKLPAFIGNLSLAPTNIYREMMGYDQVGYSYENDYSKMYAERKEKFLEQAPILNKSITEEVAKGNYRDAGMAIAAQVVANSPDLIAMIGMGPIAGPLYAGGVSGGEKASQLQAEGVSPLQSTGLGVASGAIETVFEKLGTMAVVDTWMKSMTKDFGKQSAVEVAKNFSKTLMANMFQEGSEEFLTSVSNDFVDYITGVNPDAMKGSIQRAADAFAVGSASGGAITAPVAIGLGVAKRQQIKEAQRNYDLFMSIADTTNNSKLMQRMPEKYRQYVENVTKDGSVENTYISMQGFNEYFQTKNINPVQAAQELGILEQYNSAMESGTDMEVKTADVAVNMTKSEHFQAISEHLKFSPEQMTAFEARVAETESKRDLEIEYENAKAGKDPEQLATIEQNAKQVADEVTQMLVDQKGYSPRDAKKAAQIYEKFFLVQGIKSNQDPYQLYKRYGLRIISGQQAPELDATVFEQPTEVPMAQRNEAGDLVLDEVNIDTLRSRIAESEAGKRVTKIDADTGEVTGMLAEPSTFPDFFQDKGYTKKEAIAAIDKYKSGKKLTQKQSAMLEDLYNGMVDKLNRRELFQTASKKGYTFERNGINNIVSYEGKEILEYSLVDNLTYVRTADFTGDVIKTQDMFDLIDNIAAGNFTSQVVIDAPRSFGKYKPDQDLREMILNIWADPKSKYVKDVYRGNDVLRKDDIKLLERKNVLFQTGSKKLGFYSKLVDTIEKKMGTTQDAESLKAMLKDIKPEEMKWLGLDDYLKGKTKVNKADLLEYLKANDLQLEEVTRGYEKKLEGDNRGKVHRLFVNDNYIDAFDSVFQAEREAEKYTAEDPEALINIDEVDVDGFNEADGGEGSLPTKYSQYTVPGGENYREVLIRLPGKKVESKTAGEIAQDLYGKEFFDLTESEMIAVNEEYQKGVKAGYDSKKSEYKSSHWDETNILAFVRLKDRVDSEGKKVLFVEEIQSDWHQEGRKKGYKVSELDLKELAEKRKKLASEFNSLRKEHDLFYDNGRAFTIGDMTRDIGFAEDAKRQYDSDKEAGEIVLLNIDMSKQDMDKLINLPDVVKNLVAEYNNIWKQEQEFKTTVPDAPFKKNWHEFAFKRILTMAVNGGYDRVAWTTGEQQAERYDLSKQVREIKHQKIGDDKYTIDVVTKGGSSMTLPKEEFTAAELEDVVGKEVAAKIVNDEGKSYRGRDYKTLEGLDLKIGGEGMKGFYDKMLVSYAKSLGKKFKSEVKDIDIGEGSGKSVVWDNKNNESVIEFDSATEAQSWLDDNPDPDLEVRSNTNLKGEKISIVSHAIEITPELEAVVNNEGFSLFQERQGSIAFGQNRQFTISLFESKNESTFLHESAHFFFEVLADLATGPGATEAIQKEYGTILKWLGANNRDEVTVDMHEQLARGFEAYLMEGKAPSSDLRRAFATFKNWMISIYKNALNLDVPMSDEIRGVFDRLLATDEELSIAQQKIGTKFLFGDPAAVGMNSAEQLAYLNAIEWAKINANDELRAKLMKDLITKKDAAYNKTYKEIYEVEMKKAKEMPEFKTIDLITGDMKLSKPVMDKNYSEFKNTIPNGSTQVEAGAHPDFVASIYGYENGQAMLQAIAPYRRGIETFVEMQVATQMKEKYPELLESPELSDEALKAAHTDKYRQVKKLELEYLAKNDPAVLKNVATRLIRRLPTNQAVIKQAAKIISDTPVKEIKPHIYRAAEKKYASEAAKQYKAGNFDLAFEAKRKEYLNFELYRAAVEAKEEVDKSLKQFKKLFKSDEKLAKGRDIDIVNAAQAILAEFGIIRAEKTASEYLEKVKQYDPEVYEVVNSLVLAATRDKGQWDNIKFDSFIEMRDSVMALWDLSKSRKEIEIDGQRVDIDEAISELNGKLELITPAEQKEYDQTVTKWGMIKEKLLGAKASLIRIEHWTKAVDVKDGGPFWRMIFRPISDATAKYRLQKLDTMKKYRDLIEAYKSNITYDAIKSDELKFIFKDKAELMMAILHSGNESNQRKLLLGRGWGSLNPDGSVNVERWNQFVNRMIAEKILTKADFDFAQSIWDLLESLKPNAQKAHKQMYGFYFNEITAQEFTNEFGTYRGGYVPAKADIYSVEDAAIRREREEFESNNNSFQFPTAGRGFTKSRVKDYTVPLSLDINLLGGHLDGVLRFTYIEPRVKEVSRIVLDKGFRAQLAKLDSNVAKDAIVPWLQRAAQQQVVLPSQDGLGRVTDAVAKTLRKNVAMQMMFGNITNTLQQATGLIVAMSKVKPKYIRNAFARYVSSNKDNIESIMERSDWMKSTHGDNIFDIHSRINEILLNPSKLEDVQEFMRKHTYFLQSAAQNMVNTIVWSGAYEQAIENGMTEKEAVKEADSAVRTTQGTTNPEDISRYETGTATELLFKQFVSYFNMLANLNASELIRISREVGLRKGAGRALYLYMFGFMLPAFISDVIVKAMGNGFDEDDDDNYLDDLLASFFGSQFKTFAATIPYGGQVAVAAYNKMFTDNPMDDRLSLSPAISIIESTVVAPAMIYQDIVDKGEIRKKSVKDALQFIGIMTGVPAGPVGRPAGYLMDVSSGKAEPTGPIDFARGLVTGKPGQ